MNEKRRTFAKTNRKTPPEKGRRAHSLVQPDIEVKKARMLTSARLEGEVNYNDGMFAEVLTCDTEGIDRGLRVENMEIHIEDTADEPEEFQQRFPVGATLSILTITEITVVETTSNSE